MYYVCNIKYLRRYIMNSVMAFFKDIFSYSDDNIKIGLSQFKEVEPKKAPEAKSLSRSHEVKLSDLMRKSY